MRNGRTAASGKETINVLRRLIVYSGKIFHFSPDILRHISDNVTALTGAAAVLPQTGCYSRRSRKLVSSVV
jgi:hypothetical protein